MKAFLSVAAAVAIACVCLTSADLAGAQTTGRGDATARQPEQQKLQLTPAEKATIFTAIRRSAVKVTPLPTNLPVAVGVEIPSSVQLYAMPETAITDVPDVKPFKYTFANDTLLVVDPVSMRVVETIRQ